MRLARGVDSPSAPDSKSWGPFVEPMSVREERVLYFSQLGLALAAWSAVEAHLWNLVAHCFDQKDRPQIGTGFAALTGFDSKLRFADACIERTLRGTQSVNEIALWQALHNDLRDRSQTRNHLAHWQTGEFAENETEGRRIALCPWINKKRQVKTKPPPRSLCVVDIARARLEFDALTARLENILTAAVGLPLRRPKADEQASDPPTIRELRLSIREALGHPQRSAQQKRQEESAKNAEASLRAPIPTGGTDGAQIESTEPEDPA
jgi:hypothetical protein